MLYKSEEHVFYRVFGRNRPIETIDGYDGTVHRGPFKKMSQLSDLGWSVQIKPLRCVIKRIRSRPWNRDPTVRMRSARWTVITPLNIAHALM